MPRSSSILRPDLVNSVPTPLVGSAPRQAISFAYSAGDTGDTLARLPEHVETTPSTWQPACFARDLFLSELCDEVFQINIGGRNVEGCKPRFLNLLCHPPTSEASLKLRQDIFNTLSLPAKRTAFETLYQSLVALRSLLMRSEVGLRADSHRRRIEILATLKESVEHCEAFNTCDCGLARLSEFAATVRARESFVRLCELVELEQDFSTVDVRIGVGSDGSIRRFELLRRQPNQANPLYRSPIKRLLTRLWLFITGHRVGEHEVLVRLCDAVFGNLIDVVEHFLLLIGDLEFYLAGLAFKDRAKARGLDVCLAELVPETSNKTLLTQAFNPFLLSHDKIKPTDIHLNNSGINIITGPNSGGKTRLLQTLSLCQLLGQSGLFVPAATARLPRVSALLVSLNEPATSGQGEGRLGMELLRIRSLFERLRPGSLVLVDELCSGTNPSEGEEIFELVAELLNEHGERAWITTHFLEFARRLESEQRLPLHFLQVELDDESNPTYQFVPGVAKTSLARLVAERLGVTRNALQKLLSESKE